MSETTRNLATVCKNIIRAQGLSREDQVETAVQILLGVSGSEGVQTTSQPPKESLSEERLTSLPKESSTPPPKKETQPSKLIQNKGKECACESCKKVAYRIVRDVYDPMDTVDFMKAYMPVGHDKELTMKTEYRNLDGNFMIDCPHCKGDKTVALIGSVIGGQGDINDAVVV